MCDEGDIFGVRAIVGGTNYLLFAQVAEESLIYDIPVEKSSPLLPPTMGSPTFCR